MSKFEGDASVISRLAAIGSPCAKRRVEFFWIGKSMLRAMNLGTIGLFERASSPSFRRKRAPRTMKLYERVADKIMLDEVERIVIRGSDLYFVEDHFAFRPTHLTARDCADPMKSGASLG